MCYTRARHYICRICVYCCVLCVVVLLCILHQKQGRILIMNVKKCTSCRNGKIMGLGMIDKKCPRCNGYGILKLESKEDDKKVKNSKKVD